ncbi:zinc finger protein 106-like [Nerophis ophidion]|uniref:zinc finger protein 106-like n=1 Tax=Nerophis ophidion TaxID=159077 RepID=UPI002ADF556D|nr:zinc finger protein 106-like [Nerophis ophidion]
MEEVSPPPGKRKRPIKSTNFQNAKIRVKRVYCLVCRILHPKTESLQHIHGMKHHKELELALGNVYCHDCQACNMSSMDIGQYTKHICTVQHQTNLNRLSKQNVKANSLNKTLSPETIMMLKKRNQNLAKCGKKEVRKNKKKQKQIAGQKRANTLQYTSRQPNAVHAGPGPGPGPNRFKQGNHTAVVQNKENKLHKHFAARSNHFQNGSQLGGAEIPRPNMVQHRSHLYQAVSKVDFTSDQLPEVGSLIFDQYGRNGSSQPPQSASVSPKCTPHPVSIEDMDVNTMLKEIRRALGVREPCRADREARKQSAAESGARPSEDCSSNFNKNVETPQGDAVNPAGVKQVCAPGPSVSRETSRSLGSASTVESNGNSRGKVRIAHKATGEVGVRKAIPKTPALSGPKWNQKSRQPHNEVKTNTQESKVAFPRFGIQLANPKHNQTPSVPDDLPLSEGFHWESLLMPVPDPRPPRQGTPVSAPHAATQSESRAQAPSVEHPPPTAANPVKVEPENENYGARKRKCQEPQDDGVPNQQANVKRKKTTLIKDQNQMDQLLAVSLREEELSCSLQDLDKSLSLARNALQVAYTEVQRLMLLKQQCSTEVDSLRARRIEILQGMQEVYSATSNVVQVATPSTAGSTQRPSTSVLASLANSHQTPTPASFTSQPPLAALPTPTITVKQEAMNRPAFHHPHAQMNDVNTPATTYPALLPTPPTRVSPIVAPPTAAACKPTKCSAPVTPPLFANSSYMDAVKRESLSKGEIIQIDSEHRYEEHPSAEHIQVHERVAGRHVPSTTAAYGDKGDDSDDLMEVMDSSKTVVIIVDESENEDSPDSGPLKRPGLQEAPQKCVGVQRSSSSTWTNQQHNVFNRQTTGASVSGSETTLSPGAVRVTEEEELEPSLGEFTNHTGSVHGLQIHEGLLFTCSADNTARAYSLANRECQAVFEGHTSKVNCLLVPPIPSMPARLYTGSSDQTIRCYSLKSKKCLETITLADRVLCLHTAWNILFAGLANGSVASFDIKTLKALNVFECHGPRGVSCLGTAQEGARRVLLVGSYDSTISVRDAKSGLLLRSLEGHTKTVLCMKVVNDLVFSGSSDTSVHAHNIHTGELVRIYKGHGHAVTSIVILGKVMVTASLDKLVRVYELQSHDRLQVYGGHSDMVLCMAVHKSVIYTGCYDGKVQAVKLNLMKNYRCWWQNCSLIFGMSEHLVQHLMGDHSNPNLSNLKCRWKVCSAFFSTPLAIKQDLPKHMQSHVNADSKVDI